MPDAGAAHSAICLDDGYRWRITVNEALRWSDGKLLTAADAMHSAKQVFARQQSAIARLLAADASSAEEDITQVDTCTFEMRLRRRIAFVRELLCLPQFAPRRENEGNGTAPVLGLYLVEDYKEASIILRPHYNTPLLPGRLSRIVFQHITSIEDAIQAYDAGEIDVTPITGLGPIHLAALRSRHDLVSKAITLFACLEFGHQMGVISRSARLRTALASALNRLAIAQQVEGLAQPWWSHTAPWDGIHIVPSPEPISGKDLADIRHACPNGVTVAYANFAPNDEIAKEICYQLREALGIPVQSIALTFKQYVRAAITRNHSLLLTLTTADFPHPAALLSPWRSGGAAAGQLGLSDPILDQRISAAESCLDVTSQLALWRSVDDRWHEITPRIPLLQLYAHYLCAPHLSNFELTSGGLVRFERIFDTSERSL